MLISSWIHYDFAMPAPDPDAPQEFCASVVPESGSESEVSVLEALRVLVIKLRAKRAYTNTETFDLEFASFCHLFALRVFLWLAHGCVSTPGGRASA